MTAPAKDDLATQITSTIAIASNLDYLLWLLTYVAAAVLLGWLLFGGQANDVLLRASALVRIWPLVVAWCAGLVLQSRSTATQRREVLRLIGSVTVPRPDRLVKQA